MRILCDMTTQIERISLVVGVLGSLLISLLSFSSKASSKISSAMFYTIRARYLHNTTESFMRLMAGPIYTSWVSSKDRLHLARYQPFPDYHGIFHAKDLATTNP